MVLLLSSVFSEIVFFWRLFFFFGDFLLDFLFSTGLSLNLKVGSTYWMSEMYFNG